MNCYVCAKEGQAIAAVAACAACGMGLCMDHAHERTVSRQSQPVGWGESPMTTMYIFRELDDLAAMPLFFPESPTTTMYIFCEQCAQEPPWLFNPGNFSEEVKELAATAEVQQEIINGHDSVTGYRTRL